MALENNISSAVVDGSGDTGQALVSLRRVLVRLLDENDSFDRQKRLVLIESLDYLGARLAVSRPQSTKNSLEEMLHGMRGSLNTIQAATQLVHRSIDDPKSVNENKQYLEAILDCVQHLATAVAKLSPVEQSRAA